MKKISAIWKELGKTIYTGRRLKANLVAITLVSIVSSILGLILIIIDIITHQNMMLVASVVTFVTGVACAVFAGIIKNRDIAIIFPTAFCVIAFTIYAFTGAGYGTAVLWSLLLPIGMSYFVSVKAGLILSSYYSVLYFVLFYSPLKAQMGAYYTDAFMVRFPLLYLSVSLFTGIAMVQYHRAALFEIEHTNKLNEEVAKQTEKARERAVKLENITEETVRTLARVIDAKDEYTKGHSFRVSAYSVALAEKLGWSSEEITALRWEALLHDIGKIGVPDVVLNKPDKLTENEFAVIRSHAEIGGDILAESEELKEASNTARHHHERYDGKGYPDGLAAENIPVHARVVSIADSYDAMHSDRIYRKGLSNDVIRKELEEGRGTQFCPEYLDVFLQLFDSGELDKYEDMGD